MIIKRNDNANKNIKNTSESEQNVSKKNFRRKLGHQFIQHKIELRKTKSRCNLDSYLNKDIRRI